MLLVGISGYKANLWSHRGTPGSTSLCNMYIYCRTSGAKYRWGISSYLENDGASRRVDGEIHHQFVW